MKRLRVPLAYAIPLTYVASLWLVLIYDVAGERGRAEPTFVLRWLRDATVALPLVLAACWLALRVADNMLARRGDRSRGGPANLVTAAAVALGAGVALAVVIPIRESVLGERYGVGLPLPIHMLRDALIALFVTVPVSAIVVAFTKDRNAAPVVDEPGARRTNRAAFLKAGAGGLVTVAGGGAVLRAVSTPSADAATVKVTLLMNEGYSKMTDGSPCWVRGFGIDTSTGAPLVPGPPIGSPYSSIPIGEVPFVLSGQTVELTITNGLKEAHSFFIKDVVPTPVAIPAGQTTTVTFNTPLNPVDPGTYIYADADPIQRILGLHGVLVVMPSDGTRRPYTSLSRPFLLPAPTFDQQFIWVISELDPVWGAQAQAGQPIVFETFLPRFFTINGLSGEQSVASPRNLFKRSVVSDDQQGTGKGTLVRLANAGGCIHSPHFHGNHVYVLTQDGDLPTLGGVPALSADGRPVVLEKDVFSLESFATKEVLLPFHTPYDQWPPYDPASSANYRYPMHCHAEMSQTAGGGQYPSGMYVEWELSGPLGPPKPLRG